MAHNKQGNQRIRSFRHIYFWNVVARSHNLSRGLQGGCSLCVLPTGWHVVLGVGGLPPPGLAAVGSKEMLAALRVRRVCTLLSSATAANFDALLLHPTVATISFVDCCAAAADVRPALLPPRLSFSCILHFCCETVSLEVRWTAATSRVSPPPGASGFTSSLPPSTSRWPSCFRLASAFSRSCLCRWKSHVDSCGLCGGGGRRRRTISAIGPACPPKRAS